MVNLVRVAPTMAEDDPQIEAAKQQVAMAMAAMQRPSEAGVPIAQGAGAVQAKYGWGNALTDLANKLAQGYALGKARQNYAGLQKEQDDAMSANNQKQIEALAPALIKGGQVPVQTQLAAVPDAAPQFNPSQDLAAALAGRGSTPLAPNAPSDQVTTLNESGAVPDQLNPDHAKLEGLAGSMAPRQLAQALAGVQMRNAFPDPAVVESQKMREAMFKQTEQDKAATLADRQQGRADTLAASKQAHDDNVALRREAMAAKASDKAAADQAGDEGMRDRAAHIVAYEAAPPSGMGSNTPASAKLWKYIQDEENRTGTKYDATKFNYYQAGRKAFTQGKQSDLIRSLDVARRHIDTLEPMIDALHNGDYRAFNAIGNSLGVQMGDTAVTNYNQGADILSKEVEKALIANGGTGTERAETNKKFGTDGSPQQMHEGLGIARKFLGGQLAGLLRQGSAATGWDQKRLSEELQLPDALNATDFGSAGGAPAPVKIASDADYAKLQSGTTYTAPDGSVRTKK